jgi:hypothetical protein
LPTIPARSAVPPASTQKAASGSSKSVNRRVEKFSEKGEFNAEFGPLPACDVRYPVIVKRMMASSTSLGQWILRRYLPDQGDALKTAATRKVEAETRKLEAETASIRRRDWILLIALLASLLLRAVGCG